MRKYIYSALLLFLIFCLSIKLILKPFVPVIWLKVDDAFHHGNYELAEKYLSFISWINPKDPQPYILKGWLLWSEAKVLHSYNLPYQEKLKCAVETYRKGQEKVPSNWQLYFEEGVMWEAFGENEKAVRAYYYASKLAKGPYSRIYQYKSEKYNIKIK